MKTNIINLCVCLVLSLAAGCATVPMATQDLDLEAKSFLAPPDMANIYIYRNEMFGGAVKMTVLVDDQFAGDTASKTYILKTVEPGAHTIISKSENDATLFLDVVAGQNYYVWQEVKMGQVVVNTGQASVIVPDRHGVIS